MSDTKEDFQIVAYEEKVRQNLQDQYPEIIYDLAYERGLITDQEYQDGEIDKKDLIDMLMENISSLPNVYKD